MPRTIESLHQIVEGLEPTPDGKRHPDALEPALLAPQALDDLVQALDRNMPRTIESLHQIVEGLWGKERRLEGVRVPFAVRGFAIEAASSARSRLGVVGNSARKTKKFPKKQGAPELDPILSHIVGGWVFASGCWHFRLA
jgi:hypothetical protein